MKFLFFTFALCIWHLANSQQWIIEPRTGMGFNLPFEDGLAIIQDEATGLYGLIDTTGKEVMSCQFINRPYFNTGQAVIYRSAVTSDETLSYLLEKSGRMIQLSHAVDISLGHNYFAKIIQPAYDMDIEAVERYVIYKIAKPELLQSGSAISVLQLVPILQERMLPSVHAFSQDLMLIDDQVKYFIRPDGSTAFELPNAVTCGGYDAQGYAQYMDADQVHLINTKNEKVHSMPRDMDRSNMYYYDVFEDGYALLTSVWNDQWETYLLHLTAPKSQRNLGSQVEIFSLGVGGRYWEMINLSSDESGMIAVLKNADGAEIQRFLGYQIECTHREKTVLRKAGEMTIVDARGKILQTFSCDYSWYGGDGYMWVTMGDKTGLYKMP
jgi:hypothetical protein